MAAKSHPNCNLKAPKELNAKFDEKDRKTNNNSETDLLWNPGENR